MTDNNVIAPLQVTLRHPVERRPIIIAAINTAVVVVLYLLIAGDELGGINSGIKVQPRIPALVIELAFIGAVGRAIRRASQIVIRVVGVAVSAEETVNILVKFMLEAAPKRFITKTVAIAVVIGLNRAER